MLDNKNKIFKLVLFAMLTALCYVATFIMIPLPTGAKIHLGNLVCILASLLLGGVEGGLVGSLGMGLNDLHFYLDSPSTIIRTFVLKFIMGFVCGTLYRVLMKKKPANIKSIITLFGIGTAFLALAIFSLVVYLKGGIALSDNRNLAFNVLVPIGLFLFSGLFFIFGIVFIFKKTDISYLMIAVVIATLINILGEVTLRIILGCAIDKYGFDASVVISISRIPASLLTGILTSMATIIIYPPLSKALGIKNKDNNLENYSI